MHNSCDVEFTSFVLVEVGYSFPFPRDDVLTSKIEVIVTTLNYNVFINFLKRALPSWPIVNIVHFLRQYMQKLFGLHRTFGVFRRTFD